MDGVRFSRYAVYTFYFSKIMLIIRVSVKTHVLQKLFFLITIQKQSQNIAQIESSISTENNLSFKFDLLKLFNITLNFYLMLQSMWLVDEKYS